MIKVRNVFLTWCILSLVIVAAPSLARSQAAERIATLDISVWPEFDDPRVLVQYDGDLVAQENYPREVSFYIPANAELTATAYADETNTLINTDPATITDVGSGQKRVTFQLPKPHFHLEFYYNGIQGAPNKTVEFTYNAALPADKVSIQVQQPLKSENFTIEPPAMRQAEGEHGFKYRIFDYSSVTAEQSLKLQVSYTKTDPNPSIQIVVPPASAPQSTPGSTLPIEPTLMPFLVGAGTLLVVGVAGLWLWRVRSARQTASARRNHKPGAARVERPTGFCTQCGNPLFAGDNFCPKCGTLKREEMS